MYVDKWVVRQSGSHNNRQFNVTLNPKQNTQISYNNMQSLYILYTYICVYTCMWLCWPLHLHALLLMT